MRYSKEAEMTYKYFSVMRPIGIGTLPNGKKPVRIENYNTRKQVTADDGRKLMAWGEVEYDKPLTDYEMYSYELKGGYEYEPFRHVGYWMNDGMNEIIKLGQKYYVLFGWNGESFGHCWECLTPTKMADTEKEYTLKPVHYFETEAGIALMDSMNDMDEDSDEWYENETKLNEVISYTVSEN